MPTLEEKIDALSLAVHALAQRTVPPAQWDSYLVSTGQAKPVAPTGPQVAADPGRFYGTVYDPLTSWPTHGVVTNFATMGLEEAFIGGSGPVTLWFQRDPEAFKRWFRANFNADLNMDKLHPAQRSAMGL